MPADAWGLTPWDRNACRKQLASLHNLGLFTPTGETLTLMYPGSLGGPNWGGGAFDPARNLIVTNVSKVGLWLRLLPQTRTRRKLRCLSSSSC